MSCRNKLKRTETLISQAFVDLYVTHEEYNSIIKEEENYRRIKENIRMMKSGVEKDELNEGEGKKLKTNKTNMENSRKVQN